MKIRVYDLMRDIPWLFQDICKMCSKCIFVVVFSALFKQERTKEETKNHIVVHRSPKFRNQGKKLVLVEQ